MVSPVLMFQLTMFHYYTIFQSKSNPNAECHSKVNQNIMESLWYYYERGTKHLNLNVFFFWEEGKQTTHVSHHKEKKYKMDPKH